MSVTTRDKGIYGEKLAARYLKRNGYRILERNYRAGKYEIDLVAQQPSTGCIVFVEVKSRSKSQFGLPCEAVDANKQRYLRLAATSYLQKNNLLDSYVRFDVVEVYFEDKQVHHIVNAF